jgi:hypothetical protein
MFSFLFNCESNVISQLHLRKQRQPKPNRPWLYLLGTTRTFITLKGFTILFIRERNCSAPPRNPLSFPSTSRYISSFSSCPPLSTGGHLQELLYQSIGQDF